MPPGDTESLRDEKIGANLAYELPTIVKSCADGWLSTLQSVATVSALLAALESQLLVFLDPGTSYTRTPTHSATDAVLVFTYSSLIFSLSATISSIVAIAGLSELPIRASRLPSPPSQGRIQGSAIDILESFGNPRYWRRVMWFCTAMLFAAVVSAMLQIVIYAWLQESATVKAIVLVLTVCIGFGGWTCVRL